jgi:hypothetical protein
MLISKKHKFIFIHVPKNAGTSVHNALLEQSNIACRYQKTRMMYYFKKIVGNNYYLSTFNKHIPVTDLKRIIGDKWNQYQSFAICRNPYDRIVSRYHFFKKVNDSYEHRKYKNVSSFKEHVMSLNDKTWNDLQTWYISTDGKIGVDHLLRFESLEADWKNLLKELKLPSIELFTKNRSPRATNYLEYYDQEILEKVNQLYKYDFEMLGYDQISTLSESV